MTLIEYVIIGLLTTSTIINICILFKGYTVKIYNVKQEEI